MKSHMPGDDTTYDPAAFDDTAESARLFVALGPLPTQRKATALVSGTEDFPLHRMWYANGFKDSLAPAASCRSE